MTTRSEVVACARSYIGSKWHHQGRSKTHVDCAGLVIMVAHDLGLFTFNTFDYGHLPHAGKMQEQCNENLTRVQERKAGSILLMKLLTQPQHLAIDTGEGTIIHSLMEIRKVCEHRLDAVWKYRIVAIYDYPGIEDG